MAVESCGYVPVNPDEEDHEGSSNSSRQAVILEPGDHRISVMDEGCAARALLEDGQKSFEVDQGAKPRRIDSGIQRPRLSSLDVFRGLTVILMILVDDAGGIFPAINHSPWDGVTLADFVMPFFLFMVGVSIALAHKRLPSKLVATKRAALRACKLLMIGLFVQGGFLHGINDLSYGVDISRIRWMGVLQRIAIAYLVAALCEIWLKDEVDPSTKIVSLFTKYKNQWVLSLVLTMIYLSLLYGLSVPDWQYIALSTATNSSVPVTFSVKCGLRGDTSPACNAVGMIDRKVLGINHLYRKPTYLRTKQCSTKSPANGPLPPNAPSWCQAPFDPEGLLSSVMAIVTTLIGLHFGHIMVHFKARHQQFLFMSLHQLSMLSKMILCYGAGMSLNKALYSLSYTCITAGVGGILFAAIYTLVDVYEYRRPMFLLEWVGTHSLKVFVIVACNIWLLGLQGFYLKEPKNNIVSEISIFFICGQLLETLLEVFQKQAIGFFTLLRQ
ncbi:hypothetical protein SAY87_000255 [Trapa incisa]|uniref:Heparan-alpha-glucosaminide N-acetyltransferase catalytic domain-containing protein n=1 Tax=Trapa incisa TaxID=236973 RepID=A0AAN7JG25_9MYRT|nr:hypothetical protein SAY87_000255 [Trapa incisa]